MLPNSVIPHWLQSEVKNSICITLSMPDPSDDVGAAAMAVLTKSPNIASDVTIFIIKMFL